MRSFTPLPSFRSLCFLLLSSLPAVLPGQADTASHRLTLRGSADAYYATHSTDADATFTPYLSAGPRDNQFGLNVAELGFDYTHRGIRGTFTYQVGDIPASSWSGRFPNIQEANAGVRLAPGWWLDAGFFTTHIGYESILPREKYLSSTAYLSWNEPFFQSGLRLSYRANERWALQLWVLNGYNSFVDNNNAKSVGLNVSFTPSERTTIVYNNLLGNEALRGEARKQFRAVHNVYWEQRWSPVFLTVINADYFSQSNSRLTDPDGTASLSGAFLTARYQFDKRWSLTGRAEYYADPDGFVSGLVPATDAGGFTGLEVTGLTLSAEYEPTDNAYLRAAGRLGRQGDEVALFRSDGQRVNSRLEVLLTFGVAFERVVGR